MPHCSEKREKTPANLEYELSQTRLNAKILPCGSLFMKANAGSFCASREHIWRPNRREFLFVGLVGSLGLSLGNLFKLQAQSAGSKAAAQSVINIFLPGG